MSLSKYLSVAYQGSIQVKSLVVVGPCCGLSHLSCSKMLQNLIKNGTDMHWEEPKGLGRERGGRGDQDGEYM